MSREAMKLALEAFEAIPEEVEGWIPSKCTDAIIALKQALEQPEPEPVAWTLLLVGEHNGIIGKAGETFESHPKYYKRVDVYTSPPKREWQGLTDEESKQIREEANQHFKPEETRQKIVQELVEAKLKEKNT